MREEGQLLLMLTQMKQAVMELMNTTDSILYDKALYRLISINKKIDKVISNILKLMTNEYHCKEVK